MGRKSCFSFNLIVLRPFKDYFNSYETGQSVGGAKTGEPREKTSGTPASRTWLVSCGQSGARTHTRHSPLNRSAMGAAPSISEIEFKYIVHEQACLYCLSSGVNSTWHIDFYMSYCNIAYFKLGNLSQNTKSMRLIQICQYQGQLSITGTV